MRRNPFDGRLLTVACTAFLIAVLAFAGSAAAEDVRIRAPQGESDTAHDYYRRLLELALQRTQAVYGPGSVSVTTYNVTQTRSLRMVEEGKDLDLDWAGTNAEREQRLRAIRIPLNLGLLGYRMLSIRKDRIAEFDSIESLDALKRLKACQGSHWPDSDILESAGFDVLRTVKFETMYKMVRAGRCDYFPRSIIEGYGEVRQQGPDVLFAYDRILIAYKFPMYFFVSKSKPKLAGRIEKGLLKALADGSFLELMQSQSTTASAFPLARYSTSVIYRIDNPYLTAETPLEKKELWLEMPPPD